MLAAAFRADFCVFDGVKDLAAIKAGGVGVDRFDLFVNQQFSAYSPRFGSIRRQRRGEKGALKECFD